MREIKFRGKYISDGEWVYGDLVHSQTTDGSKQTAIHDSGICQVVDPATIGQFTGLRDKNGKEIYEGDVVLAECNATMQTQRQIKIHKCEVRYSVDFHQWQFPIIDMKNEYGSTGKATSYLKCGHRGNAFEVIGNIHDSEVTKDGR